MGDSYLGCPNCEEPIYFPLVSDMFKYKPNKCSKCGIEFDWSDYKHNQQNEWLLCGVTDNVTVCNG